VIVSCQSERSQHQNKATALSMLQSRLRLIAREQQYALRKQTTVGAGDSISWGNQIRSVVMQPYQMVKDHRSGWETGNVGGFLHGDMLTDAMLAALRESAMKLRHDDS
jgi:peptide chain release factor 2